MNRWFGEPLPRAAPHREIPVPVGETCYLCGTPIAETDSGEESMGIGEGGRVVGPMYAHIECLLRTTQGCFELVSTGQPWTPGHVCHGQEDYRADALKVWAWFHGRPR
jgi:hypothetical protein